MGTLKEKLSYLSETKEAIKQALIKQQVTVTDEDTFRSYADKISGIEGGGGSIQKIDAGENETGVLYRRSDIQSLQPSSARHPDPGCWF